MFYECVKGDKILRECADGLYFSKRRQGCVKIEDSDCKRKKPPPKCSWEGEFIPHECDCTKYYKCRRDDQVLRKCDDGLHFSPKRRKCEHPDKAGCNGGGEPPGPGDCPYPTPEHPWRHECDCRLFYKCEGGKKRLYECPWGYYFDMKRNGCSPRERIYLIAIATVFLALWSVTIAKEEGSDKIPTKCPAVDPMNTTVHLAHESDCTKFYMCLGGMKIPRDCPYMNKEGDRLHFNPRLQVCDWPWQAGCEDYSFNAGLAEPKNVQSHLDENQHGPYVMDEIPTKCPAVDPKNTTIHLAHETDCTKFYMCHAGKKVPQDCPYMNEKGDKLHFNFRKLHFNPRLQVCDWPSRAGCKKYGSSDEQTESQNVKFIPEEDHGPFTMDEIPTKCPAVDPKNTTIHLAHESDCTKFYMCRAGKKIPQVCPYMNKEGDRLHFNPRLQVCDWPSRAGCKKYGSSDEQTESQNVKFIPEEDHGPFTMDEIPTKCPAVDPKNTTIHLAHESDCTKFYMCRAGKKIPQVCPYMNKEGDRLHFNPRLQVCDWPSRAGCKKYGSSDEQTESQNVKFIPEEDHGPFTMDEIPTKCPAVDPKNTTIHLAHESDCTKFYMCRAGKKIPQVCPYMNKEGDRLHFNPRLQVCDWPWRAGCKKYGSSDEQTESQNVKFIPEEDHGPFTMDEIPTKCPAVDPKNTTIHLAHESDCTKFYMCRAGKKIPQVCPYMNKEGDRLHFNPRLQVCDWPSRAGCKKYGSSDEQTESQNVKFIPEEDHGPFTMDEIPTKCPAVDPKNTTIHLAHESDCTKFYMCRAGKKIPQDCPYMNKEGDRLHFNPRLQVCDWPWHAGCKDYRSSEEQVESKEFIPEEDHGPFTMDEIPTKCPAVDPKNTTIHLAHESDCTKFYMCRAGKKIPQDCPYMNKEGDRLHFNPHLQVCDWPWRAGCRGYGFEENQTVERSMKLISKKNHSRVARAISTQIECPKHNLSNKTILLPHEYDCTKFYMCVGREKIVRNCPYMNKKGDRLHFNPRHEMCDWPDKAGCDDKDSEENQREIDGRHFPGKNDESSEIPTKCPAKDPKDITIHLAHEYDCTKFYKCHAGKKFLLDCPYMNKKGDRLHFNARLQVCDWPWAAGCETSEPGDDCPWDNDGLLLPHERNCAKFYECMDSNKRLRECADGLFFSRKYQGCVKIEDSDCEYKRTSSKCTCDDELIPHECDCSMYYKCRGGDQVLRQCDKGLHFSPKQRRCEDPAEAGCGDDDKPGTGDCPDPTWEYPWRHECDCRLFYRCEEGKKRMYECPWGYYFHVERNGCSLQERVSDCKNHWDD
ncbi:Peritrophin-1 [Harpegnathos saltator]|uniref:Peritrophin-1 n=1 Tax=Harpegnathos saltator TaxID=610380 RepID=E2C958_HARSA|nr:Peritrophin-1 [Harpegnathos saltator]